MVDQITDIEQVLDHGRTFKVTYIDSFEIELHYLAKNELFKITRKSQQISFDRNRQRVERLDSEAFDKRFCEAVFVGWTGLTIGTLKKIIPIVKSAVSDETELAFSVQNATLLCGQSLSFSNWLWDTLNDLSASGEERIEAEKKTS
jgi:hypothetical protein